MDDKFADRMLELSEISPEVLEQRWATVVGIATSVNDDTKLRLVLIACGQKIDRDTDEWFWKPFRENEATFKVDSGSELHTRLAEAAARYLINDESDSRTAMLVRLALNAGHTPKSQDLIDDSVDLLQEARIAVPGFKTSAFWTPSTKEAFHANPNDPANLETILSGAQTAVSAVAKQLVVVTRWAQTADARYTSEQRLIEWLLNGARSDGKVWSALSAGAAAVDAAREAAEIIIEAPQRRHEAMLLQVLVVAGHPDVAVKSAVKDLQPLAAPPPAAIAAVTPILGAVAAGKAVPKRKPSELALRTLWEARAIAAWSSP